MKGPIVSGFLYRSGLCGILKPAIEKPWANLSSHSISFKFMR